MPEQGKKSIAFPADVHQRVKIAAVKSGLGIEQYAANILEKAVGDGEENGSPTKAAIALIPAEVVIQLAERWKDPRFRKCVQALIRIWDVGDSEFIESITRDCATFQRISNILESTAHGGVKGSAAHGREGRVEEAYENARALKPGHLRGEGLPGSAPPGRARDAGMGKRGRKH